MPFGINWGQTGVILGAIVIIITAVLLVRQANKDAEQNGFSSKNK